MCSFANFELVCCCTSGSNCCFLSCMQVSQETGIPISLRIFQFVVIHTVKGFSIIKEAEVDVLLEFSCSFYDPTSVDNLISDSSAFSKSSLYIWKFFVHVLLNPSLKDFEHYLVSMWNEHDFMILWTFFGIVFLSYKYIYIYICVCVCVCVFIYIPF